MVIFQIFEIRANNQTTRGTLKKSLTSSGIENHTNQSSYN